MLFPAPKLVIFCIERRCWNLKGFSFSFFYRGYSTQVIMWCIWALSSIMIDIVSVRGNAVYSASTVLGCNPCGRSPLVSLPPLYLRQPFPSRCTTTLAASGAMATHAPPPTPSYFTVVNVVPPRCAVHNHRRSPPLHSTTSLLIHPWWRPRCPPTARGYGPPCCPKDPSSVEMRTIYT